MSSLARLPFFKIRSRACLASSRSGRSALSQRNAALALASAAVTSLAIEGVKLPHCRGVAHMRQLDRSVVEPFIHLESLSKSPAKNGAFLSFPRRCEATMARLTDSSVRRRQLHRNAKPPRSPKTAVTPLAIRRAGRCWTSVVLHQSPHVGLQARFEFVCRHGFAGPFRKDNCRAWRYESYSAELRNPPKT